MIYYLLVGTKLTEFDLMKVNHYIKKVSDLDMENYQMDLAKQEHRRNSYSYELELQEAIATGDVSYINRPYKIESYEWAGQMAKNDIKQFEYLTISTIAIATRSAITAGMLPRDAYNLSDLYMQKTEACTNKVQMQLVMGLAVKDFIEHMNHILMQERHADYVEQCKEYIALNYQHPIKVENIAKELGMNRTYLSRKFSEQTGITIKEYIQKKRMEVAANLLKYSEDSVASIAAYLSFHSQSYFGKIFYEEYNMTPLKYRKRYKTIEFISNEKKKEI